MAEQSTLKGKIQIQAILRLETGLHIGASSDFAPIGAVDSPFVRDPLTREPVIPGSSLKGKIRTLLARSYTNGCEMKKVGEDVPRIARLFGSAAEGNEGGVPSRLQFFDIRLTEETRKRFAQMDLDTYFGEVKWENAIDRITAGANPRQIERVPAGLEFAFRLTYNVEREAELMEDMETLRDGLKLLQLDYLGGHGSRGYGRVSLRDFSVAQFSLSGAKHEEEMETVAQMLEEGGGLV